MIRFSKWMMLYFIVSACVIVPGVVSLVRYGLRPAIDFSGGTLLELRFNKPLNQELLNDSARTAGIELSSIQSSEHNTYLLRMKSQPDEKLNQFEVKIASVSGEKPQETRKETVGPVLGKELLSKAVVAALFAITAILAYIAYAFKNIKFGIAAIVALIHDLLVVLGMFSLFGHFFHVEVDTLFVTAFLTTMSFSVHDTIVVFDRIREYRKHEHFSSFEELSDRALTETISRSLTNSLTIIFMLLALALMGGSTIRWFVIALLIGTVSGSYSSPFIATPVLILLERWSNRKRVTLKKE
jgi:preprotein translocase subunit SecF